MYVCMYVCILVCLQKMTVWFSFSDLLFKRRNAFWLLIMEKLELKNIVIAVISSNQQSAVTMKLNQC